MGFFSKTKENLVRKVPVYDFAGKNSFNRSEKKSDQRKITYIPIENIRPNPYQPRRNFEQSSLEELCNSIREYGVIQPINVRKTPSNHYELVSGERRLRASMMAGLKEIPAIVIDVNEDDLAIMALL